MPTLVLDPAPREIEELLEKRRRWGVDQHDEVWEGVLHMVPGPSGPHSDLHTQLSVLLVPLARTAGLVVGGEFNLGDDKNDFRVPDLGVHRTRPRGTFIHSAAIVVEILSPGDETWQKLPFYAAHGVEELLIVDPADRTARWFALEAGDYREVERSAILSLGGDELAARIDWPPAE